MSLRTGPAPAPPAARRRLLRDQDLAALLEALPGLPLPREHARAWSGDPTGPALHRARAAAWHRLVAAGVLRAVPRSPQDVPGLVEPAVLAALTLPARADVLVRARSWAGDTAVDACLAVAGGAGSGTVRRADVTRTDDGVGRTDVDGLELSAFAAGSLLEQVVRALPPVEGEEVAGRAPVRVGALRSAAVVAALRAGRADAARELGGRAAGGASALDARGEVPQVLADLAAHRAGAFELSVRRPRHDVAPVAGAWWLAGPAWWRVRTVGSAGSRRVAAGPARTAPEEVDLVLEPTTRAGIVDDVLDLLASALGAGGAP